MNRRSGHARISFLARKDEINEMYQKGHPLLSIFEKYQAKLNISYGSFVKYAKAYLPTPSWKVDPKPTPEPERSEEERLHKQNLAEEKMLDLCEKLVTTFIETQEWLPEKYGRLAGFARGFVASERDS